MIFLPPYFAHSFNHPSKPSNDLREVTSYTNIACIGVSISRDIESTHTYPLGVLIKLIADVMKLRVPSQIPEVDTHLAAVNRNRLHAEINSNCSDVFGDELKIESF